MKKNMVLEGQTPIGEVLDRRQGQALTYTVVFYGITALMGVLMPRAVVYGGLAPFGVSVAACVEGPFSFLICICAAIGYLLPSTIVNPMRYLAALIVVVGVAWVFGNRRRITDSAWFSPLLAAGSTFLTGVALGSVYGFQMDVLLAEFCEAVLAGGFAYFFREALSVMRDNRGMRSLRVFEQASLVITVAVLLMAFDTIVVYDISVGRVLTMFAILLAAKAGHEQGGMLVGVILGASTAFCMPEYPQVVASFAFGGLVTGLFARFGRAACAGLFLLVHILVSLSTGSLETVVIAAYEAGTAALLFLILPKSVERAANGVFCRVHAADAVDGLRRAVDMRLLYAADTMSDIAQTVDAVSSKLAAINAPDFKEIYGGVCEGVCSGCRRRNACWKETFTDTMSAFRDMGELLRQNGVLRAETVPSEWRRSCTHVSDVLSRMNLGYQRYCMKEHAHERLSDIRSVVTDQFEGMASLLTDLSEDFRHTERADEQTIARVERVCARHRIPLVQCVCLLGRRDRLSLELLIEGDYTLTTDSAWFKELCDACGCELDEPVQSQTNHITKVHLSEKTRLRAGFAAAQLCCCKEKLCGDSYEQFYDHEGRYCLVLSDGMGTGGRAAVDGAMTAALASRMLKAGFSFTSVLRVLNSAMIAKSGDESLATLDAVTVDLFTGHVRGFKAGAAPSFICSGGHVSRLSSSSLPVGILKVVEAEQYEDYLHEGDIFVMVSDGVVADESEWLEELLIRLHNEQADESTIANEIVFYARERQDADHTDDTTALVARIY